MPSAMRPAAWRPYWRPRSRGGPDISISGKGSVMAAASSHMGPRTGGPQTPRIRRAPPPDLGRLLEGVRELQHAPVVLRAPDDLDSHRQAVVREAAGDGD